MILQDDQELNKLGKKVDKSQDSPLLKNYYRQKIRRIKNGWSLCKYRS